MFGIRRRLGKIILALYERVTGIQLNYKVDGLYTRHNVDFLNDEKFVKAYNVGKSTDSWGGSEIQYRCYIVCWAAAHVQNLEGDFVECGVNKGGYSRAIIDYINFEKKGKNFYLLDTFNGLVEQYMSEAEKLKKLRSNRYTECYEYVKNVFKQFSFVRLVRGPVPDTLPEVKSEKICYLSLDMNCAMPELAAANFFWDRLVKGGVIVLDDYAYAGFGEQKNAMDEFAQSKNVQVLCLPTGQGLIFKP